MTPAAALLRKAATQFRMYEANHRAKDTVDSLAKAEVNALLAAEIEDFLDAPASVSDSLTASHEAS